ncbi:MAG TPA: hypothetical protein VF290_16730 [Pyrinomonadaceae bacterium]
MIDWIAFIPLLRRINTHLIALVNVSVLHHKTDLRQKFDIRSLLVPAAISCIGLALQYREIHKLFFALASIFVFAFWVYVSRLYRASASSARQVLMAIEREWGVKEEFALYNTHGQVGLSRYGLFTTQVVCLAVLIVVWIILLILLRNPPAG